RGPQSSEAGDSSVAAREHHFQVIALWKGEQARMIEGGARLLEQLKHPARATRPFLKSAEEVERPHVTRARGGQIQPARREHREAGRVQRRVAVERGLELRLTRRKVGRVRDHEVEALATRLRPLQELG